MNALEATTLFFEGWVNHFLDPNKRLYWGYMVASALMAALVLYRIAPDKNAIAGIFDKRIWLHTSAKQDYAIWLINLVIKLALITPLLFSVAPVAIYVSFGLEHLFGEIRPIITTKWAVAICYTSLLFIIDDLTRFLLHYLLHKVPFLWQFHQVHHSAQVMTPITVYRIHPVESALYAARLLFVQGLVLGLSFYLFGHKLSLVDVLGANLFVFIFNVFGANLRHSHIWLRWPTAIQRWFISPAQHQLHHSRAARHRDINFGTTLAVWDRLFRSLVIAAKIKPNIAFGVRDKHIHQSLISLYWLPIRRVLSRISGTLSIRAINQTNSASD